MKNTFKGKIIVTKDNAKVGVYVQRGRDWRWHDQDCVDGKPSVGKIISEPYFSVLSDKFWVKVKWVKTNIVRKYRVDKKFDLVFADESYKPIINHL